MVRELHKITEKLYHHLKQPLPKEEREEYIEEVHKWLDLRNNLLKEYPKNSNGETDLEIKREIIKMDKEISNRIKTVMLEIKMDINKLKQQRETGLKYENPYQGGYTDGVFFDKKN